MTIKYIILGHDLEDCGGHYLRIGAGEKLTELDPHLYVNQGNAQTDGSVRIAIDEDTGLAEVQKRITGLWKPASLQLGPNSLWVGLSVGIAGVGHHLVTESADGHLHFHTHSEFDGEETVKDVQIVTVDNYVERQIFQPDESGNFTGTNFEFIAPAASSTLVKRGYLKTHTTAATSPIRIRTWLGTDDTGLLIFDQFYPASDFPALTEVPIDYDGHLEFEIGNNYFTRYSSDATFSLKTNAAVTFPWVAVDTADIKENNVLQTVNWTSGDSYAIGDWLIDHATRKIYICSVTGVQTGTFAGNADKWDDLQSYADYKGLLAQNVQNTGLVSGAVISKASSTTLDISPGTGYVADYSDPANPTTTPVTYAGVTGYTPVNLATDGLFVIGINASGALVELGIQSVTNQDERDYLLIGVYIAFGGVVDRAVPVPFNLGYNAAVTARDFIRDVIGPANVIGNLISANGTNLNINTSGGIIFIIASNFRNNPEIPDELPIAAGSAISFYRVFRAASPSVQLSQDGPLTTFVNPDKWDDGSGTLADVPVNDFTIQVIYATPGAHYVVYGQEVFNTMDNAETALIYGALTFDEYPTLQSLVQRSFLIVREGTTDLTNTSDAQFFDAGKFRAGGVSTSGGIPGITVPGGSNTQVQFNDNGVFGGDSDFVWDKANKRLGVGTNAPVRALHLQDDNAVIRIDRDTNSPAFMLCRFPNNDYTTPWKTFVVGVGADGVDDGTFHISDTHQAVGGGGDRRLTIENDGNVGIGVIGASSKLEVAGIIAATGGISTDWNEAYGWGDHALAGYPIGGTFVAGSIIFADGSELTEDNANFFWDDANKKLSIPTIENKSGLLKIQPDVQGDVELFGDTDVGNGDSGKIFKVWRKAAEGNDYIRMYISANRAAYIHASRPLTLQAQVDFTINSVTEDIIFKVGDNAGVKKFYFQDSDNNSVAIIDSDGEVFIAGDMGIGTAAPKGVLHLSRSGVDYTALVFGDGDDDTFYIDAKFAGTGQTGNWLEMHDLWGNDLMTWRDGKVGIGTTDPEYLLSLFSTSPLIKLENSRTIMGMGYNVGALLFTAGESGANENVAEIRVNATEDWEADSYPTRMSFYTTPVGATHGTEIMRIDEAGRVSIGIIPDTPQLPLEVRSADNLQAMFFDDAAQDEGVGGGIAFGGKYTDAGAEALSGKIETKKTNNTSGHVGFDMLFETQDSVGNITERMIFTSDGLCGIHAPPFTDPTKPLDVWGDVRIRGDLTIDDNIIAPLTFESSAGQKIVLYTNYVIGVESGELRIASNGKITFMTDGYSGDVDVVITDAGYLGIGTDTPHDDFHIVGTSPSFILEESDAIASEKVWELTATNGMLKLLTQNDGYTGSQTVFEVDRGGTSPTTFCIPNSKVGIRTTNPSGQLTVDQPIASGGIPVLTLDQGDVDEPWIEFLSGTISGGMSGTNKYIKVKVQGSIYYLRLFD